MAMKEEHAIERKNNKKTSSNEIYSTCSDQHGVERIDDIWLTKILLQGLFILFDPSGATLLFWCAKLIIDTGLKRNLSAKRVKPTWLSWIALAMYKIWDHIVSNLM